MALLAGVFAGVASALDFNDDAEEAPRGEVGKIYRFEMPSHGGCFYAPYRYVLESGELPPGVKLGNARNLVGLVDGVPTEAGVYRAWIALKDICGNSAELLFTFEIWARRWSIATDSLKPATVGADYSAQLQDQGIQSNVTYEVTSGTLPAGLTLSPAGQISGTPMAVGSSTFTVKGTAVSTNPSADGTRVDSKTFTLNVSEPLVARLSTRAAEVGVRYVGSLSANGGQGPYTWAASSLPVGLSLGSSGSITGTPATVGSYSSQMTVTDANGNSKTTAVTFRVAPKLVISTKSVRGASVGSAFSFKLGTKGGVRPVRWSIARGALPTGLRLNAVKGTIAAIARATASARVTLRAKDAAGGISTKTFVVSASG
ncbi:MAG: putative Ig domain-containing protein [Actinobacteria bacterium]|nr:putative Ig domain-containing protein [Actinomycetota bacterium]